MSSFIKILLIIGGAIAVFLLHFFAANSFLYPFNLINFSLVAIILVVAYSTSMEGMYFALPVAFFHELFSGTPYGFQIASIIISTLLAHFILRNFFTNHSVYIIFIATCILASVSRMLLLFFTFLTFFFHNQKLNITNTLIATVGWEILLSGICATIFYILLGKFIKRMNPKYISAQL